MTIPSRWRREPMLHFILLGAALFALHRQLAPPVAREIVLSRSLLDGLRQDHLRRRGAPPTAPEEAALVERFLDDEFLYREALALGLDRGDVIVRRRLIQKMEFLTEDMDPLPAPTDAELQAWLDAHAARYAAAERLTLVHVFVDAGRHGKAAERVAGADPSGLGDPFLRGRELRRHTERELAAIFGTAFAARLEALPMDAWSEPLRSAYGYHLVRVSERLAGGLPPLAEFRAAVTRDWLESRRVEANRAALDRLRRRYVVRRERGGTAPAEALAAAR